MKQKETNTLIIVLAIVFGFAFFFSFAFLGMGPGRMHGSDFLCANVGGIWCYWPAFGFMWVFMLFIPVLILITLVLFIIWLVRQLENPQKTRRRR